MTLSYTHAPATAPAIGARIYTAKNPPRGPGIAISPQPAKYANTRGPTSRAGLLPHPANQATSRGPKSRAGLNPACVSGAITEIKIAMVRPIRAAHPPCGTEFRLSVIANTKIASSPVPIISAANAVGILTHPAAQPKLFATAGLGKYSP